VSQASHLQFLNIIPAILLLILLTTDSLLLKMEPVAIIALISKILLSRERAGNFLYKMYTDAQDVLNNLRVQLNIWKIKLDIILPFLQTRLLPDVDFKLWRASLLTIERNFTELDRLVQEALTPRKILSISRYNRIHIMTQQSMVEKEMKFLEDIQKRYALNKTVS